MNIGYCNYLSRRDVHKNKILSFISQSGTHSRAVWLMYLVTVQVKKEDWEIFKC